VQIELPPGSYMPKFRRSESIPDSLTSAIEAGQQLLARPFPPLEDARLRQLHDVAASLHAGAGCEFTRENADAQSKAGTTYGDELEVSGSNSLLGLIGQLAEIMHAHCVYIGTVAAGETNTVKTIEVVAGGQRAENFEYVLAGSPCEKVVGKTILICPQAVRREYPDNLLFEEMDVESYVGAPLFDCRARSLGLVVMLFRRPLRDPELAKVVLGVYAGRISAALERKIAEHVLYESERRHQALFESAGGAILLMRGDRFVGCNLKAVQLLGRPREQILGQRLSVFSPIRQSGGSNGTREGMENIGEALNRGAASFDWQVQRPDGSIFDTHVNLIRVGNVGPPHLVAYIRDVTHSVEGERRVGETEERFRAIFRSAGIGIAILDLHGRILESNLAAQAMLGYSEAELMGMAFSDYTHPADLDSDMHLFTELLQGKRERYQVEKRYIRKDRGVVWGVLTASLIRFPAGEPQYCIRMVEEMTERKRAEAAKEASKERLRILFERAPEAHYLMNLDGVFLDCNRAAEELLGYRREEVMRKTLAEIGLLSPADLEKALHLLTRCAKGEPAEFEELRLIRKDGGAVDVEIQAIPIETAEGQVTMGVIRDITHRKRAEQALRESEESSRAIIETAPDGIYILTDAGQIIEVNDAACRQLGYSREHLLRSQLSDIVAPQAAEEAACRLQEKTAGTFETIFTRADGTEIPLEFSTCQFIFRGRTARLGIGRDTTERKQAEKERASLHEQLQQAQKLESVGRLAGGVAHDFNNLLTVINGYSEMALSQLQPGDPLRDCVDEIRKAGDRAAGLARQLLVFSRKHIVQQELLDLNAVVTESEKMLGRLLGEDIELIARLDPSLGLVMADSGQFQQVLMNLVVNARDAMPHGGRLTLETANVNLDESDAAAYPEIVPGPFVMLAVSDTGVGIEKEVQGHIFDSFFTTKGEGKGTGLGLYTVYGIVRQCGGAISVFSEPGQGATFKIYLPRTEDAVGSVEVTAPAADEQRGSETLLIVEDQEAVRKLAVHVLTSYGYRILEATEGAEALSLAERYPEPIDLMLTDVLMPLMTGKELAERLRPLRPHLRVLYMSGYTADHLSEQGLLDEGALYIAKPFAPDNLAAKVREALEKAWPAPRILVVDDEESVRTLFRLTLAGAGYRVVEATNGKQALAIARARHFDLLVTDLVMPEREGIETIRTLRKEQPDLKIVAVSGAFGGMFLEVAKSIGANATLAKPISSDALLATVRSLLPSQESLQPHS
jgi:hypothetical protein